MAEPAAPEADSFEDLTRALRGSLASLRAAAETLELFPQMEEGQQRRLRAVVGGEALRLGQLIDRLEALGDPSRAPHQPPRRRTSAAELAAAIAARASSRLGLTVEREDGAAGEEAPLELDFDGIADAAVELLGRLRHELEVGELRLRQRVVDGHAVCDLLWQAEAAGEGRLLHWQSEALDTQADGGPGLRPLLRRHGGETWFNLDRDSSRAYLRLLLPLAPG